MDVVPYMSRMIHIRNVLRLQCSIQLCGCY